MYRQLPEPDLARFAQRLAQRRVCFLVQIVGERDTIGLTIVEQVDRMGIANLDKFQCPLGLQLMD